MGSRRHLPEESHLRRRGPVRDPKIEIWVYCEGKRTEPAYLTAFRNDHATHLVRVETVPVADVPLTLVNRAVEKKLELERAARRSKDSFAKAFAVWGMFDVDHDRDRRQGESKRRPPRHIKSLLRIVGHPALLLPGRIHQIARSLPEARNGDAGL